MNSQGSMMMMKHRNTGRKKIPIKKIEETTSRQVTFSKRRTGLFKKASELCVLTGAEMAILIQSPGGHCYAFGHPSVEALINRYEGNNGSSTLVSPKQPSVTELNLEYAELEKELEREKMKYEMIRQEIMGKSSCSEFVVPWFEQDIEGLEVEELEHYLAALGELKRKVLVRAGDLNNMESGSMLSLGPSSWNNLDIAPLNMQVFDDALKMQNKALSVPTRDLDFGDGIKFVSSLKNGLEFENGIKIGNNMMNGIKIGNNMMNGPKNGLDFGDGMKFQNNTMNAPTNGLDFGDGIKIGNNMMNGQMNGLDFGDGIKFDTNTMNGSTSGHLEYFGDGNKIGNNQMMNGPISDQYLGDGTKFQNNMMNGPTNCLDFENGIKFQNDPMNGPTRHQDFGYFGDGVNTPSNTMNGSTSHQYFGDGVNTPSNTMNGPDGNNGPYFGDGVNNASNMIDGPVNGDGNNGENGPRNDHLDFEDLGLDLDNMF